MILMAATDKNNLTSKYGRIGSNW